MARLSRREALAGLGCSLAALALPAAGSGRVVQKGRLKQSVSRWCYKDIPLPDLCKAVAEMGLTAIDLLEEKDWPVLADHGLVVSMGYGGGGTIADGLNDPANHDTIVNNLLAALPRAAKAKVPNLITFFGNRKGRSDEDAIRQARGYLEGAIRHAPEIGRGHGPVDHMWQTRTGTR